jgi:hypothetical protein
LVVEPREVIYEIPVVERKGGFGIMSAFARIQSPDAKYSVELHEDFGEIGMGSPLFGHITIRGTEGQLPDRLYGETVVFSPDSRFVALEELFGTSPFRTKLVVVELPRCTVFTVRVQPQGRATPVRWATLSRLVYTTWSVGVAQETLEWEAPDQR